jgi:hypothetical protein
LTTRLRLHRPSWPRNGGAASAKEKMHWVCARKGGEAVKLLNSTLFAFVFSAIYRRENRIFPIISQLRSHSAQQAAEPERLGTLGAADERPPRYAGHHTNLDSLGQAYPYNFRFAYSVVASLRMGMSGSASFHQFAARIFPRSALFPVFRARGKGVRYHQTNSHANFTCEIVWT